MSKRYKKIGSSLDDLKNLNFEEKEVDKVPENPKYANAPYNFIEFPDKIVYRYDNLDDLPKHNLFKENLQSGYVEYSLKNLNSLFIGGEETELEKNGKKEKEVLFFTVNGKAVVPGSTIRGRVRSNAEVLSFSYPKFVEDRKFLYRDIAGTTILKDEYKKRLNLKGRNIDIAEKVNAGYMFKNNNYYYFRPAEEIMSKEFYTIKEKKIIECIGKNYKEYNAMQVDKKRNYKYRPYQLNISSIYFEVNDKSGIQNITNTSNDNCKLKGTLYNSEYIDGKDGGKNTHYLINNPKGDCNFDVILASDIPVLNETIIREYEKENLNKNFITESPNNKMTLNEYNDFSREFYSLPKEKEVKVFFYKLVNGEVKYFGRTPYLRIFYDYATNEILNREMKFFENNQEKNILEIYDKDNKNLKNIVDYSEAIFGFTNKEISKTKISYKGRVNFTDLELKEDKGQKSKENMVLTNPKATSFQLYLKQDKNDVDKNNNINLKTYNNSKAELRGQKFYWQQDIKESQNTANENMGKEINPLNNNCIFTGKIYFENLADDELGLLLLSLKYDESTKDNIGMAKPYGYGKIEINDIELVIENKKDSFEDFFFDSKEIILSKDEKFKNLKNNFKIKCLEKYNENEENKSEKYDDIPIIRQYILSKKDYRGEEINLKYMDLEKFKKREILRDINDYIGSE